MENNDAVVRIDKELEKKIEELIEKNRFLYTSKKQVVNLAVIEFLKSKNVLSSTKRMKRKRG